MLSARPHTGPILQPLEPRLGPAAQRTTPHHTHKHLGPSHVLLPVKLTAVLALGRGEPRDGAERVDFADHLVVQEDAEVRRGRVVGDGECRVRGGGCDCPAGRLSWGTVLDLEPAMGRGRVKSQEGRGGTGAGRTNRSMGCRLPPRPIICPCQIRPRLSPSSAG